MPSSSPIFLHVAVDAPFHSGIGHLLTYAWEQALEAGTLVRVPLGKKEVLGVVWDAPASASAAPEIDPASIRSIHSALLGMAPLGASWRRMVEFTARYYQRSLGEVAMAALPAPLKSVTQEQLDRRLRKMEKAAAAPKAARGKTSQSSQTSAPVLQQEQVPEAPLASAPGVALTQQQQDALHTIEAEQGTFLLHGATGSGKTEVYMHCAEQLLAQDPQAQVLFMVPEINLTPQLQALLEARFAPLLGKGCVASLHSGLTPAQRLNHWLAIHAGSVRIVLGTRMSILSSMPHLRLIVVDEEHDSSYKQQEGARYHARDLAVWRGRHESAKVILASATPSLETWFNSRAPKTLDEDDKGGHYHRIAMPERIGRGALAKLRTVDMRQQPKYTSLAPALLEAMQARLQRGEQCVVLINRRGYSPVIRCQNCDWKSDCPHCSAHQVLHMADRSLRCHHCGFSTRMPKNCPNCNSTELLPIGQGTEQLQEALQAQLANIRLPDGRAPIVMRMDADSTRLKGALEEQLERIHSGEVDVVVGTQMIAKGHDFRRVGLVAVVQPDGALFSSDFRAPERLFALLMQAAGRAGRDAQFMQDSAASPELWLQTWEPEHPLYQALRAHDFAGFAQQQLTERQQAGLPPFVHQALLRADARTQEGAQDFLRNAIALSQAQALPGHEHITLFPPVPLSIQRIANVERAQILLESPSRAALQKFLQALHPILQSSRSGNYGLVRWLMDVDPLHI